MRRREFIAGSILATSASCAPMVQAADTDSKGLKTSNDVLRVGVIGHTGRGNYGHGLDSVWLRLPQTRIDSVADADGAGLRRAQTRLKTDRGFADYRKMLLTMKPDIVAICPRHADQHHAMAMAAIQAGAKGIYMEKPFCRTPAEADEIVAACQKHGVKLAVAHRNRYHPVLPTITKLLADGAIGKLLEIRGRGKGDRRGGAEDLWVLGSHVLNLVHYFGGEPRSCSAVMLQDGDQATKDDVRPGSEGLGLLAGNELHARYLMSNGITAYFDSIANDKTQNAGFGLQLIGSSGTISIQCDKSPLAHYRKGNPFEPSAESRAWEPISTAGIGKPEPNPERIQAIHNHIIPATDLIAAIRDDRSPVCDHSQGATTVEMISAVFASHVAGGKQVTLPLAERGNALAELG